MDENNIAEDEDGYVITSLGSNGNEEHLTTNPAYGSITSKKSLDKRKVCCCIVIAVITIVSVLALVVAVVAVVILFPVNTHKEMLNPARSCKDIPQNMLSGEYWIDTNKSNSLVQVYCDTNARNCSKNCCNSTGGWMRVANFDMTDPNQQCPHGFRLVTRTTAPLRTCGKPSSGCVTTTYPTNGIKYSRVCGTVIGYQDSTTEAFREFSINQSLTVDDVYVDGAVLTHGLPPRQHIWTFVNAIDETRGGRRSCPCIKPDEPFSGSIPPFVGKDYFCATGSKKEVRKAFYFEDPLWDGQGCEGNSTCCSFNNPPWFCKQLTQPTTDDIELRLCGNNKINNEDTPLELVEIYVQ